MQYAFGQFIAYLEELKSSDSLMDEAIRRYAVKFIQFYCKALSHRLLRTSLSRREGLTMTEFVSKCKGYADSLVPGNDFQPYRLFSMRLAKFIDSNALSRALFLTFKKIYPTPIYT